MHPLAYMWKNQLDTWNRWVGCNLSPGRLGVKCEPVFGGTAGELVCRKTGTHGAIFVWDWLHRPGFMQNLMVCTSVCTLVAMRFKGLGAALPKTHIFLLNKSRPERNRGLFYFCAMQSKTYPYLWPQVQWSLQFKTPLFNNSLHFNTRYQWHHLYIFSINTPLF